MHDAPPLPGTAAFEDRHVMGLEPLDRPGERRLHPQRLIGLVRFDPFGRRTAIGRQQAGLDMIPMKAPAGILADAFQSDIDAIAPHDGGEVAD